MDVSCKLIDIFFLIFSGDIVFIVLLFPFNTLLFEKKKNLTRIDDVFVWTEFCKNSRLVVSMCFPEELHAWYQGCHQN